MSKYLQDKSYYKTNSGKIPVKWTAPEVSQFIWTLRIETEGKYLAVFYSLCVGHSLSEIYHSERCMELRNSSV